MPRKITTYEVLISCPGDIKEEIKAIEAAVEMFNQQYSSVLNIAIQTRHWSKSSYPQSGGKPQSLLNKQFVNDCDAAIAIMWTRFGTPTDEYGSGTEEEIEIMLQAGKQVFMYFSDVPIEPSKCDSKEYKRVLAFRDRYKSLGVYYQYSSLNEFRQQIFAHLSAHFLSLKRVDEVVNAKTPQLRLRGISEDGHVTEDAYIHPLCPAMYKSCKDYRATIVELYHHINTSSVEKVYRIGGLSPSVVATPLSQYKPVEIKAATKTLLQGVAESLEIELSEDFFELGTLEKSTVDTSFMGNDPYKGSDEERDKYISILKLQKNICNMAAWKPAENMLFKLSGIKFCVSNEGKSFDEDIELTLVLPKEAFLTVEQFPTFEEKTLDLLCEECPLEGLLGINTTAFYSDYESSCQKTIPSADSSSNAGRYLYSPSIEERYEEQLRDLYCYSVYEDGTNYLVKLNFDYIKHNTAVALPTPIFVHHHVDSIEYKITSKHSPDVVSGKIKVYNTSTEC